MSKLMTWLQRRPSGQYRVRVTIPPRLRRFFNDRTILTKVLGTSDPQVAKRKAVPVMAELQRQLQEAEAALANPAVAAYRAVQEVQASNLSDDQAEALDSYRTTKLEDDDRDERQLDPAQRATYRAILNRDEHGAEDNPPLSVLFDRWRAERQPPAKTWQEWTTARKRLEAVVGGDVPVRSITKALFRAYKDSLVRTPTRHGNSATLSPASLTKGLGAIRSILAWAVGQGYLEVNPADGIRHAGARHEHRVSRLPYDADDLRKIFGQQRTAGADTWLPLLGLWTGARLEELGGLRVEDVKDNDIVPHLFIQGTHQRRLKNKGSERRSSRGMCAWSAV
jgi:Phage integrase SAM-like domain